MPNKSTGVNIKEPTIYLSLLKIFRYSFGNKSETCSEQQLSLIHIYSAESYYTVYAEKYNNGIGMSNENWTGGVSVSVVKSSELPALATATKGVLQTAASMQDVYKRQTLLYPHGQLSVRK